MKRLPDWPARLAAFMNASLGERFEWGANDCATFSANGVLAITAEDPIADLRGQWSTALQAARRISRLGGLEAAATARLGLPFPVAQARRGDIVLFPSHVTIGGMGALGLVFGDRCGVPGVDRLTFPSIQHALCCWAIGEA